MSKRKIFVLTLPYSGHVNPTCGIVTELQDSGADCVVYSAPKYQEMIEKTGAQFRMYADCTFAYMQWPKMTDKDKNDFFVHSFKVTSTAAYANVPQLIQDIETDKPDLIFFDSNLFIARFLYWTLQNRGKQIKIAEFVPNFVLTKEMFKRNSSTLPKGFKLLTFVGLKNPFKMPLGEDGVLKIVAVFPELHPDITIYDETYKFVGQCVAEEARSFDLSSDPELKALLESFSIKGDDSNSDPASPKLILMSLGTVFNVNDFIFEQFIQDICDFDKKPERRFKSSMFQIILAVGQEALKALDMKKSSGKLNIPRNVLLRSYVPQLEILKRADLFITHCGMNSASETIKFAVPIVGIPIEGDQPFVADRLCDELNLGIRISPLTLKAGEIGDAVEKVLGEPKFRENMREMSRKSATYNGRKEGTRLLFDLMEHKNFYEMSSVKHSKEPAHRSNKVEPLK